MSPRAWVAIKLTMSGVMVAAQVTKSPSFSRSSSSTTMMTFPAFRSSTASSMLASAEAGMGGAVTMADTGKVAGAAPVT